MAGTFSQIYIQTVFAVKGRQSLIDASWENDLYKYITGIVQNKQQKMYAINGMPDHLHIFFSIKPSCCISDLVREIKKASNDFINENHFTTAKFSWQEGFGAFSYSQSAIDNVVKYILNQKQHHQKKSFQQDYKELLEVFQIEYKDEYLFEWL